MLDQFGPVERKPLIEFDADDAVIVILRAGFELIDCQRLDDRGPFKAHVVGRGTGEGGLAVGFRNAEGFAKGVETNLIGDIEQNDLPDGSAHSVFILREESQAEA